MSTIKCPPQKKLTLAITYQTFVPLFQGPLPEANNFYIDEICGLLWYYGLLTREDGIDTLSRNVGK
jgi:hypothetical protein